MSDVNTVVFDLGGVLVDWNPRYLLRDVMPGREAEMETILMDVINHDWNLARDAGDSWPAAMAALEAEYPQWTDIFRAYDARWGDTLGGSHEATVEVLKDLKAAGTPLFALSNWSAEKFPEAEARFDWLNDFEDVIVSGRVKMVKPDTEIFEHMLERFHVQASDVFFIDDNEPNVRNARAMGIYSHHFHDAAALRADLISAGFLR